MTAEPWLILGKGPSFTRRSEFDLSRFRLMSLNHAAREQEVLAAHVIDLDVVEACAEAIDQNAQVLVMPWYPHIHNSVGRRTLTEIATGIPILQRLEREGRLLWYDLSTSPIRYGSAPVVEATYFSAEAALNLLAQAGVRRVRTLGVDGGSEYSGAFEDLRNVTLLANGQSNFDLQFKGFARTILTTGVDFAPLDRAAPVLIYSMYSPNEALPLAVLEHSIRRRASLSVEFVQLPEPVGGDPPRGPGLVLSPRALMQGDVRRLWPASIPDRELLVWSLPQPGTGCAAALAGAALRQAIPALASAVRKGAPFTELNIPLVSTEGKTPADPSGDRALLLHFSADGSEPWLSRAHPLAHLWIGELLAAVRHGAILASQVAEEVRRGHARPSLLYQIEHGIQEPALLPGRARRMDRDFRSQGTRRSLGPAWLTVMGAVQRELSRRFSQVHRAAAAVYHMRASPRIQSGSLRADSQGHRPQS